MANKKPKQDARLFICNIHWLGRKDVVQTFESDELEIERDICEMRSLLDEAQTDSLNIEIDLPVHRNQSKINRVRK